MKGLRFHRVTHGPEDRGFADRRSGFTIDASEGGAYRGTIKVTYDKVPGATWVTWVFVTPSARRRGVATALYLQAARETCRRWKTPLSSEVMRTGAIDRFWQKQHAKGRATRGGGAYTLTCPAPRTLDGGR